MALAPKTFKEFRNMISQNVDYDTLTGCYQNLLTEMVKAGQYEKMQDLQNLRYIFQFRDAFRVNQSGELCIENTDLIRISKFAKEQLNLIRTVLGITIAEPDFEVVPWEKLRLAKRNRMMALEIFSFGFTVYSILLSRFQIPVEVDYDLIQSTKKK